MIDHLKTLLESASEPSRELDCMMHECLTGQVNMWDDETTSFYLGRGRMLVDMGSERRWIDVPRYTEVLDECLPLLDDRPWGISGMNRPGAKYCVMIVDEAKGAPKYFSDAPTAALAMCIAVVSFRCSR